MTSKTRFRQNKLEIQVEIKYNEFMNRRFEKMKKLQFTLAVLVFCTSVSFAEFDYTISNTYEYGVEIEGEESLLVTGGGQIKLLLLILAISKYKILLHIKHMLAVFLAYIFTAPAVCIFMTEK